MVVDYLSSRWCKFTAKLLCLVFTGADRLTNNTRTAGFHLKRNISFCLHACVCVFVGVCLLVSVGVCLRVLMFVRVCRRVLMFVRVC